MDREHILVTAIQEAKAVKHPTLRKFARRAGTVVLVIIALDLIATTATVALGAVWLRR